MPSRTSDAARVASPSTSSTGVVSSIETAIYAASSGGRSGTLYSSAKSSTAVFQFASLVTAEFQNTVATASRSGTASSEYGTPSSHRMTRAVSATNRRSFVEDARGFIGNSLSSQDSRRD